MPKVLMFLACSKFSLNCPSCANTEHFSTDLRGKREPGWKRKKMPFLQWGRLEICIAPCVDSSCQCRLLEPFTRLMETNVRTSSAPNASKNRAKHQDLRQSEKSK